MSWIVPYWTHHLWHELERRRGRRLAERSTLTVNRLGDGKGLCLGGKEGNDARDRELHDGFAVEVLLLAILLFAEELVL
jgi:hypothetical protein